MFFSRAPIATKLQAKAIAGLSIDLTELNPLRKYPELTISHQETVCPHQDFLEVHSLFQR